MRKRIGDDGLLVDTGVLIGAHELGQPVGNQTGIVKVGDFSFGHAAFFGIGVYAAAFAVKYNLQNPALNMFLGGVASVVLAAIIGFPFILFITKE
jgi:hypothetical protein